MNTGLGRIIVNCASILTGNFLNKLISIAVLACLTGFFSPSEFGRYSFVISYIAFFGIFTDLGINTLLTRDISGKALEAREGFGHAISIRLIYTVTTVLAVFASLWFMGYTSEIMYLAAAASLSLFFSFRGFFFRTVFDIPFQVNLKMGYPAVVNFLGNRSELGRFGFVDQILSINPTNQAVGGNLEDVEVIDLAELFGFGGCRPSHARELIVESEQILEGDCGQGVAFTLHRDTFLGFDRLVESLRIAPARHQSTSEFIDNDHFAILDHILFIFAVERLSSKRLFHMIDQLNRGRTVNVRKVESRLHLANAFVGQRDRPLFFVDGIIITGFECASQLGKLLVELG